MRRLAPTAFVWLTLAAAAAPATAVTPVIQASPGETVVIPASTGWEVVIDACGQMGTVGGKGSTFYLGPSGMATFGMSTDPNKELVPSDQIVISIAPDVVPGVVIVASWTAFHDGCFSAHGGVTINTVAAKPKKALSASRTKFVAVAIRAARAIDPLADAIRRHAKHPRERKPLLAKLLARADAIADDFDLAKLAKPTAWRLNPGVDLRKGQLTALPDFARDLKKISEYEKVMVDKADSKYATDPDFHANVDHLSALQFGGRTYAQLTPEERATIASQVQPQSGALDVLLRWARDVGKSATHVIFGK